MENCVTIKRREYGQLLDAERVFNEKLREVKKEYEAQISDLKKALKPDYIIIDIVHNRDKYREMDYYMPSLYTSTLNLSQGLHFQIRRLLDNISKPITNFYIDRQKKDSDTIAKLKHENEELQFNLRIANRKLESFGFKQAFKKFLGNG
jgi:hypothetical protein